MSGLNLGSYHPFIYLFSMSPVALNHSYTIYPSAPPAGISERDSEVGAVVLDSAELWPELTPEVEFLVPQRLQ